MLNADVTKLEVNALKLRVLYEDKLREAARTGKLDEELYRFIFWVSRQWRGCTQEIEGINAILKILITRAPSISLQLASARLTIRKALSLIGARGPEAHKWSVVEPLVNSILDDCVQYSVEGRQLNDQERRWADPTEKTISYPARHKLVAKPLPEIVPTSPDFVWACRMNMLWYDQFAQLPFGRSLLRCITFKRLDKSVVAWVCCTTHYYIGAWVKCVGKDWRAIAIQKPFQFCDSVRVFLEQHPTISGPGPALAFQYDIQWTLSPYGAEGSVSDEKTMIDLKAPPKAKPKRKRKKTTGADSTVEPQPQEAQAGEELGDDDELAAALAEALKRGVPNDEVDDVLCSFFGLDPDNAAEEHLFDVADVQRLAKQLSPDAPASGISLEELALEVTVEPANTELPPDLLNECVDAWDHACSEACTAVNAMRFNFPEPIGGRLGQHMSLVRHTKPDGTDICTFAHWVNIPKKIGRLVNVDNEGKLITIVPARNREVTLDEATLLFPDTGVRGDRRLEKAIRVHAPKHPLR